MTVVGEGKHSDNLIPQSFLDEVQARTTMSELVSRRVKLTRNGREFKACCPVHEEKTPSFTVNDDKGFAHCFGCGFHAAPIRWLTEIEGLDFLDAVRQLAEQAGMAMPERSPAAREKAARVAGIRPTLEVAQRLFMEQLGRVSSVTRYLAKRGIDRALAEKFGIGVAPESSAYLARAGVAHADAIAAGLMWQRDGKSGPRFAGRVMVPVHDPRGRVVGFGGRVAPGGPDRAAKYINSPDSEIFDKGQLLFNLHRAAPAIRSTKRALVVEGYFDVIALTGAGIEEAVAPMGTALTESQLERLWRLTRAPILMFDGDEAGRKAARRACERALPGLAPDRTLKVALLPRGQDPDDLVQASGRSAVDAAVEEALPLDSFLFGDVAARVFSPNKAERPASPEHEVYRGVEPIEPSPEERASVWEDLAGFAARIEHDELRGEYLAAWRARYERLISGVERPAREQALHTVTSAQADEGGFSGGSYHWPESEDESEKRLIAVVRRLLDLRADERAAMEPIREERKFVRELARMAGLQLKQVDAVVKMVEMDLMEGSSAGRHESESVLVLYRRVLSIEGPLTEAMLPVVVDASKPRAAIADESAAPPPRAASMLAWHDAGGA